MNPENNKNLTLRGGLIRSPQTDAVIARLDPYFAGNPRQVTSIGRDPRDQMRIITNYALKLGIPVNFGLEDVDIKLDNGQYIWQEVWSKLLKAGIMINPPRTAACLYSYIHPSKGMIDAGTVIPPSSHFTGLAFDIDGLVDDVIDKARAENPDIGINSYLVERANDCTHVNVKEDA